MGILMLVPGVFNSTKFMHIHLPYDDTCGASLQAMTLNALKNCLFFMNKIIPCFMLHTLESLYQGQVLIEVIAEQSTWTKYACQTFWTNSKSSWSHVHTVGNMVKCCLLTVTNILCLIVITCIMLCYLLFLHVLSC